MNDRLNSLERRSLSEGEVGPADEELAPLSRVLLSYVLRILLPVIYAFTYGMAFVYLTVKISRRLLQRRMRRHF